MQADLDAQVLQLMRTILYLVNEINKTHCQPL